MVAYTKPQLRKPEKGKTFHEVHVLGTNDDSWDKVNGLGNGAWKACE